MNYSYLRKCKGICLKGKDVSSTNCIGYDPDHEECEYRRRNEFNECWCPYYNPSEEEKNYSEDFNEVIGDRYYRRPFRIIMFYLMLFFIIVFLICLYTQSDWGLGAMLVYLIFFSIITLIGNKLYYKDRFLVAVINEQGIYTRQQFISWEQIKKVKSHYNIIAGPPTSRSQPAYLVELEVIADFNGFHEEESVYIYFSTLEMRIRIKKYLKEYKN